MTHPLNRDPYVTTPAPSETRRPSRMLPDQSTTSSTQPQQRMRARVHGLNAQSIPSNVFTTVTFDTVDFDTAGLLVANGFVIPSTGKVTGAWQLHSHITFTPGAAGDREVWLLAGANAIAKDIIDAGGADDTTLDIQILVNDPAPGTKYTVQVRQVSGGGALNLDNELTKTYFEIIHLW